MAWLQDVSPWVTLIRLNLRVLLITCLTFLFIARVNLFRALDFSPGLTFVLGLAYSQALTFRRAQDDFRLALASRSLKPPRLIDRYRASAAAAAWFIEKALHAATQSSQALRSRGFFND
jgi:cobalt/nickel transport system permease protein